MNEGEIERGRKGLATRRAIVGGAIAAGGAVGITTAGGQSEGAPSRATLDAKQMRYDPPHTGARTRVLADKLADELSILDFDVDPTGKVDSTAGFHAALRQSANSRLFIPNGTYLVENLSLLGGAGRQIVGESRWQTILKSEAGAGPIFASEVARTSTSSFHLLSDFMIDQNGQDRTAIDLSSINMTVVQRVHVRGGRDGRRIGTGVQFAAPLRKGAYDNTIYDCSFEGLARAVVWDAGANNNSAYNCRGIDCDIVFDTAPGEEINCPRIFGGRAENCRIGLREGAHCGGYFDVRFEDCAEADIEFTAGSRAAALWGGYTAGSRVVLKNVQLATQLRIDSGALGYWSIEESPQNPKISTGRHVFGAAGAAPAVHPLSDYSAYFDDYVLLNPRASVDFATPTGQGRISGLSLGGDGSIALSGFDHSTGQFRPVSIGGGASVRPLKDSSTDLGTADKQFRRSFVSDGLVVGGRMVVGKRQPAIPDDQTSSGNRATLNRVLAVLRAHGLIER